MRVRGLTGPPPLCGALGPSPRCRRKRRARRCRRRYGRPSPALSPVPEIALVHSGGTPRVPRKRRYRLAVGREDSQRHPARLAEVVREGGRLAARRERIGEIRVTLSKRETADAPELRPHGKRAARGRLNLNLEQGAAGLDHAYIRGIESDAKVCQDGLVWSATKISRSTLPPGGTAHGDAGQGWPSSSPRSRLRSWPRSIRPPSRGLLLPRSRSAMRRMRGHGA